MFYRASRIRRGRHYMNTTECFLSHIYFKVDVVCCLSRSYFLSVIIFLRFFLYCSTPELFSISIIAKNTCSVWLCQALWESMRAQTQTCGGIGKPTSHPERAPRTASGWGPGKSFYTTGRVYERGGCSQKFWRARAALGRGRRKTSTASKQETLAAP